MLNKRANWRGATPTNGTNTTLSPLYCRASPERVNAEVNKDLLDNAFTEKLVAIGAVTRGGSVDDLTAFLRGEQRRWREMVERAAIKAA